MSDTTTTRKRTRRESRGKVTNKVVNDAKSNSIEYFCWNKDCGNSWFDKKQPEPYPCPKCGMHNVTHRL